MHQPSGAQIVAYKECINTMEKISNTQVTLIFFSFVLITLSSTEVTIYHHQKTACWFAFLFLFSSCFTFVCSEMHIFFAGCRI